MSVNVMCHVCLLPTRPQPVLCVEWGLRMPNGVAPQAPTRTEVNRRHYDQTITTVLNPQLTRAAQRAEALPQAGQQHGTPARQSAATRRRAGAGPGPLRVVRPKPAHSHRIPATSTLHHVLRLRCTLTLDESTAGHDTRRARCTRRAPNHTTRIAAVRHSCARARHGSSAAARASAGAPAPPPTRATRRAAAPAAATTHVAQ